MHAPTIKATLPLRVGSAYAPYPFGYLKLGYA